MYYLNHTNFLVRFYQRAVSIIRNGLILSFFYPLSSYASESPISQGLGYIISDILYSGTGITLATLSLMGIGLACKFGYMEWKRMGQAVGGIAIVFGAEILVTSITDLIN